jgi:aromatic-L-amino-acid/L-tryptophan decarboxylase
LSRGFRALKVWFSLKAYGTERFGELIARNCAQARHLGALVESHSDFELLARVSLNIVCFRFVAPGLADDELDTLNNQIVVELQTLGIAVTSTARIAGKRAIRAAITNHRTVSEDLALLVTEAQRLGQAAAHEIKRTRSTAARRAA